MRMTEKLRRRIVRFLMLSAVLHLLVTAILMVVPRERKVRIVEQPPTRFYPAMISFAGGAKAPRTDAPAGRKKHPEQAKPQTSDLAMDRNPAPAAGRPVNAPDSTAAGNPAECRSRVPGVFATAGGGRPQAAAGFE
jgi:hypothetical protein